MWRSARAAALALSLAAVVAAAHSETLRRSGFIGVQVGAVTDETRERQRLGKKAGIEILALVEGGSAKEAGLRTGDVITAIDNVTVGDVPAFVARVGRLRAGDQVAISIVRDGKPRDVETPIKPRPLESAPGSDTQYREVKVDRSFRRTIVTVPKERGRYPAILYLTGIGCFSQESLGVQSTEAKLLHGLTGAGFVTMRVEKSGVGDSEGPACASPAADLRSEVAAYAEGLKALKAYPFVDPDNVFVVGLSIGGVEAPLVAQRVPVKGIVVLNTVSKPFLEYLVETRRRQGLLRKAPLDELEQRLRLNELCNHQLLIERKAPEALLRYSPFCKEFIEYPAPYTYMQQWAALDPADEWKRVDVPVLVVQGEFDFIASPGDGPYLRDMIESFHPGRATLRTIASMDHYLGRVASMDESLAKTSGTFGPFEPAVLDAVRDWLRSAVSS